MLEPQLIEGVLSSLFDLLKKKVVTKPADRAKFDFLIKGEEGKKIAIDVKGQRITIKTLHNIRYVLNEYQDIDVFYLITPEAPQSRELKHFNSILKDVKSDVRWIGINQYLQDQNLDIDITDDLKSSLLNLQVAALTSKYNLYSQDHIGIELGYDKLAESLKQSIADVKQGKINKSDVRFGLSRQFPYSTISSLDNDPEKISKELNFGGKHDDAIIILTDIKNFSTLVSAADPGELNELMSKYYTNARELVFKYGGVLDKFIGDAVLAIFNYPNKTDESFKKATKFCAELILMGENLLKDFQKKLDQEIETGTRVGLATGPIYALNIGRDQIEVTFIGDKINFAARLEKNSEVNGILMSNRYYHKLDDSVTDFLQSFQLKEIKIDPKDAKGQVGITTAWQIERNQMEIILE
tara:strand:- start:3257 stop:4489 length:1233 start_codon:yes stop_codon:yes gene_type:complete